MKLVRLIPGRGLVQSTATAMAAVAAGAGLVATAPTFTINNFAVDKIFQRDASADRKTITFTGTASSAPSSVLVRVESAADASTVVDYTALSNFTFDGGLWSGTLNVTGSGTSNIGWYIAKAKHGDTLAVVSQTTNWSVGRVICMLGESNFWYMHGRTTTGLTPDTYVRWFASFESASFGVGWSNGWWRTDQGPTGGTSGPYGLNALGVRLRAFMTAVNPSSQETIGIINFAIPGLEIGNFVAGQSSWTTFTSSTGINTWQVGPDFELALWHQGGNDGGNAATYATNLDTVHSQLLTLTGRSTSTLKFGIMTLGSHDPTNPLAPNDADNNTIRAAQFAKSSTTGCFFAGQSIDFILLDFGHWVAATQYTRCGKRLAVAVGYEWGYSSRSAKGPSIKDPYWVVGTTSLVVPVLHNSGGSNLLDGTGSAIGTGIDGFTVSASGGQTISAVALSSGRVVLTMSANRGAAETVSIRYGEGANPFGWAFDGSGVLDDITYDNRSDVTTDTQGFPLLSTFSSPITVSASAPAVEESSSTKRGAQYPGGWVPDKLYTPPRRKISERKIEALKELYEEARDTIPEPLQVSLIPRSFIRGSARSGLPPASVVDFTALARSLETIRTLIAAVEEAHQKSAQAARAQSEAQAARDRAIAEEKRRLRHKRDEEAIIRLLMEL